MKINRILLASIILLAIMTMGAASAEDSAAQDNTTLSLDENTYIQVSDEDTSNEKIDLKVNYDEKIIEDTATARIYIDNYENQNDAYDMIKNGDFNLTIDGEKEYPLYIGGDIEFHSSWLSVGNHTFQLNFTGNEKYNPFVFNGTFAICKYKAFVPDKITYGKDYSEITVILNQNSYGKTVYLEINGKTYSEKATSDIEWEYYSEDMEIANPYASFNLENLNVACGNHTLVLRLDKEIICKKNITIDYVLDNNDDKTIDYGFDDSFTVYLASDMDPNKISVKIDGIKYNTFIQNINDVAYCEVNCTGITPGIHNVSITYAGDKKYNKKTFEYKKEVQCILQAFNNDEKYPDGIHMYLPDDAEGRLIIAVERSNEDGFKEFANVKASGKVYIPFDNLSYGHYSFIYNYTGSDYDINLKNMPTFMVNPELNLPKGKFMMGDEISISIDSPMKKGSFTIERAGDESDDAYTTFDDGKASLSLVLRKAGKVEYNIYLDIHNITDDGDDVETYWWKLRLNVTHPITSKDTSVLYSAKGNYKVQIKDINGKAVKSGKVTFYILDGAKQIMKKTVNVKNGAAAFSYKITQGVKTYTIKTAFKRAYVSKKLTVKHVVTLKSAAVKKSAKRLTLQTTLSKVNGKYLKNKQVTFKFNGKTYKTKTNSKGIAKISIAKSVLSKLKVGKTATYQATYMKDTVKKSVKVKK